MGDINQQLAVVATADRKVKIFRLRGSVPRDPVGAAQTDPVHHLLPHPGWVLYRVDRGPGRGTARRSFDREGGELLVQVPPRLSTDPRRQRHQVPPDLRDI